MVVELITTGTELMLGRVLNTHQQWLGRQLADLGYVVDRQVAVADSGPAIQAAVREALSRADLIITTGGLGPTSDDLTRDLIARMLGRKLYTDPRILAHIAEFFASRNRPQPARTKVQAQVPEGALVLANAFGTAPGLVLEVSPGQFRDQARPTLLIMLPGPPRELQPMFTHQVAPLLRQNFPLETAFVCRTLRTTGLGESRLEEIIGESLEALMAQGLEVGYCARTGEVDVRLAARGPGAGDMVENAQQTIGGLIGDYLYSTGDESLETVVVRLLTDRQQKLALAESCTGGYLAHRVTNVPGASVVFWGGLVTYANEAKQALLGVCAETLAKHGAVSEPVVREMVEDVRARSGADYALAVTGIAGPGGGTEEKPVGTVFIGLAAKDQTVVRRFFNRTDRETFKYVTSQQALEMLRRELLGISPSF